MKTIIVLSLLSISQVFAAPVLDRECIVTDILGEGFNKRISIIPSKKSVSIEESYINDLGQTVFESNTYLSPKVVHNHPYDLNKCKYHVQESAVEFYLTYSCSNIPLGSNDKIQGTIVYDKTIQKGIFYYLKTGSIWERDSINFHSCI